MIIFTVYLAGCLLTFAVAVYHLAKVSRCRVVDLLDDTAGIFGALLIGAFWPLFWAVCIGMTIARVIEWISGREADENETR